MNEKTLNHPIAGIGHWTAKRFCHWLSMRTNKFYRLPTEAEWELACQDPMHPNSAYPWGNEKSVIDNYAVTSIGSDREVPLQVAGTKLPNSRGIFDLIGNAEEWVADGFEVIRHRRSINPLTWPVSDALSRSPESVRKLLENRHEHFANGWGVARGGSHSSERCQLYLCYTISARTNPSLLSNYFDPIAPQQDSIRDLDGDFGAAVGFRIARPKQVPDRTTQLLHWGVYFDHTKWIDLTIKPTT